MKIVDDDDRRLEIVDSPWGWLAVGVGSVVLVTVRIAWLLRAGEPIAELWVGLIGVCGFALGMAFASTRTRVVFDRLDRTITWHRLGPFGPRERVLSFDDVRRPRLRRHDHDGEPTWQLVLETDDGELPLELGFTLGDFARDRGREVAARIEDVLTTPVGAVPAPPSR